MIDIKNINNNILSNRWKERYERLPKEVKEKLDNLYDSNYVDYQLQVIKRKRKYPEIGDIFKINPREDIYYYGIVINNHINNMNGDDLLLILVFKEGVDIHESISKGVKNEVLLLPPQVVGKEYWTRGYFYNIDHYDGLLNVDNYGFYDIIDRIFMDEYGNEISAEPRLLGTYGVSTISGIACKINKEMIIGGKI